MTPEDTKIDDCPFYAHAIKKLTNGQWIFFSNDRSNRCALITDAHSPCIMQIAGTVPTWDRCPRKPAYKAPMVMIDRWHRGH